VGGALGGALSLWAASAVAQDAGLVDAGVGDAGVLDAGAPSPGASDAGELVFPTPNATGIVLNPGLIVRLSGAVLDPTRLPSDPPPLEGGLLVRDDVGGLVAVSKLVALETPRPHGAADMPIESTQVEVSTGSLALAPGRRYEVLSRMSLCEASGAQRIACLRNEYRPIGAFTTGSDVDATGPVITSISVGPSPGVCLVTLTVSATDDHAPPGALRYTTYQDGWLGPTFVSSTPLVAGEGRETLSIFPVDPSGNRGAPVEVEVVGCPSYRDGIDYLEPDPYPAPPRHVGTSSNAGCSLAREAAPRWTDGVAVSLLAAVMAWLRRRLPSMRRSEQH
jgi:hypothetical protein